MSREEGVSVRVGTLERGLVARSVLLVGFGLPFLAGCASLQVHLGMKVDLRKIPVASIELQQAGKPGIGPGQKASLVGMIVEANGRTLLTEGAGHGKVMWRDLTVTPRVVSANKKGVVTLRHDPRASAGQLPHVTVAIASQPAIHADLDIPLRYDYAFKSDFSGSSGMAGINGSDGQDGLAGSGGSMDPNNPSPGGNGGDGTNGGDGQNGGSGGDAPPVQIQMTLAPGSHPLLGFVVVAARHTRHFLVDPQGGSLTVTANGGSGGAGGKGGRGGRGGSGGIGTPNGSDGRSGFDGQDGMAGADGRGGLITVTYDPSTAPYLASLQLSSGNGPQPVMREEPVAPLW